MSSYWAGYHGDALVLSDKEFTDFCEQYAKAKNIDIDELISDLESNSVRYYEVEKSCNADEVFEVTDILVDDCDGMYFVPFFDNGEINKYIKGEKEGTFVRALKGINMRSNSCYVVFSDKNRCSGDAFFNPPYNSYEAFRQEFVNKLKDYLPEDFDYDAHLGHFSYAAYA